MDKSRKEDAKKGIFITIEGPDGSGKSTQIRRINEFFEKRGCSTLNTREPGGTDIGEKIREILLDRANGEMHAMTEALLYAASRAQHVEELIRPALSAGKVVICDRFIDSSLAYQGYGRHLGDSIMAINEYAIAGCMPDVTFLMKLDPSVGKERISEAEADRLELEALQFHEEVYRGYLALEKKYPDRIVGIDASRGIDEIAAEIERHLEKIYARAL